MQVDSSIPQKVPLTRQILKPYYFILAKIDRFINNITMYRLTLYSLTAIFVYALILSAFGIADFPFKPLALIVGLLVLIAVCYISNLLFSKIFKAPRNIESAYITAFILFFIMPPIGSFTGTYESIGILALAGVIAMASKYILAIHKKHIFNPAAVSAFITGLIFTAGNASWWAGSTALLPIVIIVGFLIVRKIHRAHLFFSFLIVCALTLIVFSISNGTLTDAEALLPFIKQFLFSWPVIFFGTIMLTEPLTTPPTRKWQMIYGAIVGFLLGSPLHFGQIYMSPEFALIVGNLFTYIVSPKQRLVLMLREKKEIALNIFHFSFNSISSASKRPEEKLKSPLKFSPGQYIEWTLPHERPDTRGNRRFFTIASSPTEEGVSIGVKMIPSPSSFKHELLTLKENDPESVIVASQVSGDFTLPTDQSKKLAFIAGGIGITPFRSMIKYLVDLDQKRDIVLFYACTTPKEFAYTDIFFEAVKVGVKFVPIITNKDNIHADPSWQFNGQPWNGHVGFLSPDAVQKFVPEFKNRTYYLSGPSAMVDTYNAMLKNMGIARKFIKTDYFPGF